jgi:chromosome segregation ATPase
MSFNFFKNFAKVKVENMEDGLITLATAIDKEGVAETVILQKMDEHNERIKMYQSAADDYKREQAEADREQALYDRYMTEAEAIQQILTNLEKAKADIAIDPSNQAAAAIIAQASETELNNDLVNLLDVIEKRAPILEKEKAEAIEAKQWMEELKIAVDEISAELLTLRKTVDDAKRDIAKAEIDAERNRKRAEQAEVIAGLRKSGNKFDTAINALKNKATEKQAESETYKIKAETLKKPVDATDEIVGKYTSTNPQSASAETLADRLARLKAK